MKKKNPYQYKQPKKKQGEKKFYQALMKMYKQNKQGEEDENLHSCESAQDKSQ